MYAMAVPRVSLSRRERVPAQSAVSLTLTLSPLVRGNTPELVGPA